MLGHEITGEVVEVGPDVEFIKVGDIVSVPFNIACGRCRNCKEGKTGICLNVNPDRPGSAYGYVDMGGWVGGQAEYVLVPYADWNLLKFPDRDQALEKILDLTMLSDIFPTGFHGAVTAGVGVGLHRLHRGRRARRSRRRRRRAAARRRRRHRRRPQRGAPRAGAQLRLRDRQRRRRAMPTDQLEQLLGVPEVDAAVDAVGFEARGHGHGCRARRRPATVLNSLMERDRRRRRARHPGPLRHGRPRRRRRGREGRIALDAASALGWAKSLSFTTGQCPVMKYNRQLMMAILHDKVQIAKAVNATRDPARGRARRATRSSTQGAAKKYVLNPNGYIAA